MPCRVMDEMALGQYYLFLHLNCLRVADTPFIYHNNDSGCVLSSHTLSNQWTAWVKPWMASIFCYLFCNLGNIIGL